MLTDPWIIAQLFAQACSLLLLLVAGRTAWQLLRAWQPQASDAAQLDRERRAYLVSVLLRMVLWVQGLGLVLFLVTVNSHLPPMLRGAMCATGVLGAADGGYWILYLKALSVFVYLLFLGMDYLDNAEPGFPLTPLKFLLVFPALFCVGADFVLLWRFFAALSPDIITTCCSVQFAFEAGESLLLGKTEGFLNVAILVYWNSAILWGAFWWFAPKRSFAHFFFGGIHLASALYVLKNFFVKYIYGLPTHTCIFDSFLGQYQYIGYVIFALYYLLAGSILLHATTLSALPLLQHKHEKFRQKLRYLGLLALVGSVLIPTAYWYFWEGVL